MANTEIAFTRIHHDWLAPSFATIATHTDMRLLCSRIFFTFVIAVRSIELPLVPGESHAQRPFAIVHIRALFLDDMKLRAFN